MTTRSVTVNVEQEEEVEICDEWGLSDDAGPLIEFDSKEDAGELHFHESCLPNNSLKESDRTYASLANEAAADSHHVRVWLAVGKFDVVVFLVAAILVGVGATTPGIIASFCVGAGVLLILLFVARSRLTAKMAAEELKQR